MSRRLAIFLLFLVIVFGVVIRGYQLTARSLWFDEAFSWRLVQFDYQEMISRDAADVHPPLYYLVLKVWSTIFETSLLSLRVFSVFAAALTLAAAYLFTSAAAKSRAIGVLAAALLAVTGFQIQYAWEARMYTLGTFLALISSWLLLLALRKPKLYLWVLYGVVTAAFAYVHYYSFFTILAQVLFIFGWILFSTRGRLGEIIQSRRLWYAALGGLVMFLAYVPWLKVFLKQNSQVQESYWIPPIGGWSIPDTFYRMWLPTAGIPNHEGIGWIVLAILPIVLTCLGWLFLVFIPGKSKDADLLAVILGVVPFIVSIVLSFTGQSLYQDRFFVFANIFVVIGLAMIIGKIKRPIWGVSLACLAVLGLVSSYYFYWQEIDVTNKPGAHAATRLVFESRDNGEPIVVTSPFIYFAILHYAQEEFESSEPKLFSESGKLAHFAGGPILTQEDIIGPKIFEQDDEDVVWVVDTTGFGGSKQELPSDWLAVAETVFEEVFAHQGQVFVTKYVRR